MSLPHKSECPAATGQDAENQSINNLNFATGQRRGKAIALGAPDWRSEMVGGNARFRKYGEYQELASGRKARRAIARLARKLGVSQ